MFLWFGKYKGYSLEDIPSDYLAWMAANMEREMLRDAAREELERRRPPRREQPLLLGQDAITRELVEAGYRALAKKFHPDLGGDLQKMQELNRVMEKIRQK